MAGAKQPNLVLAKPKAAAAKPAAAKKAAKPAAKKAAKPAAKKAAKRAERRDKVRLSFGLGKVIVISIHKKRAVLSTALFLGSAPLMVAPSLGLSKNN